MFQELMPLLAQRTLLQTISRISADEIRLNIIPQRVKSTDTDPNAALFTPLSISGTPEELDEALPAQLVEFVGAHLGLSSTLKNVKDQMDAAAKAAGRRRARTREERPPPAPLNRFRFQRALRRLQRPSPLALTPHRPDRFLEVFSAAPAGEI